MVKKKASESSTGGSGGSPRSVCRITCRIPSFRRIQLQNRIQNRIQTGCKPDPNRPRDSFLRESGPGGRCRISCRIPSFRWIQLRNRIQNRIEPDPSRIRTGLGTVFFANQVQGALAGQLPDSFLSADSAPEPDPEPDPNRIDGCRVVAI